MNVRRSIERRRAARRRDDGGGRVSPMICCGQSQRMKVDGDNNAMQLKRFPWKLEKNDRGGLHSAQRGGSKGRSAKGKAGGLLTPRSTVQFQFTESSSDASDCTMNDESTYLAWPLARRSLAVATSQYHE